MSNAVDAAAQQDNATKKQQQQPQQTTSAAAADQEEIEIEVEVNDDEAAYGNNDTDALSPNTTAHMDAFDKSHSKNIYQYYPRYRSSIYIILILALVESVEWSMILPSLFQYAQGLGSSFDFYGAIFCMSFIAQLLFTPVISACARTCNFTTDFTLYCNEMHNHLCTLLTHYSFFIL